MKKLKIISVVGARPNFVKIAPFLRELKKHKEIDNVLVHTGQHYTDYMSGIFFKDFKISKYASLNVSHSSGGKQAAEMERRFTKILIKERPDLVVVVGDVNSTRVCALTAAKFKIKVAHIEAGLRSFDKTMPEEINRILTDSVSDILFVTEPSGIQNLREEGIPMKKIFFVGNIMIDSLVLYLKEAGKKRIPQKFGLEKKKYAVLTLHRPSNVDSKKRLRKIADMLLKMQKDIKMVYPVHPRSLKMLKRFGYWAELKKAPNIVLIKPLGYIDFLSLVMHAKFVMTDSGGLQEETTYLGIPCFTLRKNTERPVTVTSGTNTIVGDDYGKLLELVRRLSSVRRVRKPRLWDGKTAARIAKILLTRALSRNDHL